MNKEQAEKLYPNIEDKDMYNTLLGILMNLLMNF